MDETQPPSSSSLEYQFVVSSTIKGETSQTIVRLLSKEYFLVGELRHLCLKGLPDSLLWEARSPGGGTLVVVAAVSGAGRWLSAPPLVETAAGTLHPAAAAGSGGRPDRGLRNRKCNWMMSFFNVRGVKSNYVMDFFLKKK